MDFSRLLERLIITRWAFSMEPWWVFMWFGPWCMSADEREWSVEQFFSEADISINGYNLAFLYWLEGNSSDDSFHRRRGTASNFVLPISVDLNDCKFLSAVEMKRSMWHYSKSNKRISIQYMSFIGAWRWWHSYFTLPRWNNQSSYCLPYYPCYHWQMKRHGKLFSVRLAMNHADLPVKFQ
jgi:hypothetical protein